MSFKNSKGSVYYGLHMYPGVAQYTEPERKLMVFLNEDTIRQMDPTFEGRPVYVMHVDGVERSLEKLRHEADGWVVESFFNEADGKHWVKFIICSPLGEKAIQERGMRLSNCYVSKGMGPGGKWNGVAYDAQITAGEYEHLALVPNPRYEESVIMTPEEFKAYNERQREELKRLKNQGDPEMKLKFWNRSPVDDKEAADLAKVVVALKSGREVSIETLVNERDEQDEKAKTHMANEEHHVQVGEEKMSVGDLKKRYQDMCNELTELKAKHVDGGEGEGEKDDKKKNSANGEGGDGGDRGDGDDELMRLRAENQRLTNEANVRKAADDAKKKKDKEAADRLRNAGDKGAEPTVTIDLVVDQIERGKQRYG